jgi:hypothetical protein
MGTAHLPLDVAQPGAARDGLVLEGEGTGIRDGLGGRGDGGLRLGDAAVRRGGVGIGG